MGISKRKGQPVGLPRPPTHAGWPATVCPEACLRRGRAVGPTPYYKSLAGQDSRGISEAKEEEASLLFKESYYLRVGVIQGHVSGSL